MYSSLKNMALKLIPKEKLVQYEPYFRKVLSVFYRGSKCRCNICGRRLGRFVRLDNGEKLCPNCGSLGRTRRLYLLLEEELARKTVLDFSPSRGWYRMMKSRKDIDYTATDYSNEFLADKKMDITRLEEPSNRFDLVICYHVLEHVPDDAAALSELYRVLKPGGQCLVQTPFGEGSVYEDASIVTPEERLKHFGQEDHVRVYSVEGLKERLERQGFSVEVKRFEEAGEVLGLDAGEIVLIAKK
jgi:SAM-dependent methyltransferase